MNSLKRLIQKTLRKQIFKINDICNQMSLMCSKHKCDPMKTKNYILLFTCCLFLVMASSCKKDLCNKEVTFNVFEPQYITVNDLRDAVAFESKRDLDNPGKIYIYQDYLFINEVAKGVHVFDNSNKSNPTNIGFINIPGNVDIGVRNGILYADSYMDLVAIKLNNFTDLKEVDRDNDVFPGSNWSTGLPIDQNGILTEYLLKSVTETLDCSQPDPAAINYYNSNGDLLPGEPPLVNNGNVFWDDVADFDTGTGGGFGGPEGAPAAGGANAPSTGVAGSTARFAIVGSKLYAVSNSEIRTFDLSDVESVNQLNSSWVAWGTETIFPFNRDGKSYLFLGGQAGMEIYELVENGEFLQWTGQFTHARACDPVVVEGNHAYVTLRNGSFCEGFTNELNVIDVTSFSNPYLIADYPMHNPYGLGIDDNTLFICDGDEGLKVFDATNKLEIDQNMIKQYGNINAADVIPYNDILLMIGSDGFYQYDYSDVNNITELSRIPVN